MEPLSLNDFLKSKLKNSYIVEKDITAYVRKSKRIVNGEYLDFLDVASITVNGKKRNQGVCTNFLKSIQQNCFVESILNPQVERICLKLGFDYYTKQEFQLDMYKIIK